jgi:hypothetical protein
LLPQMLPTGVDGGKGRGFSVRVRPHGVALAHDAPFWPSFRPAVMRRR